AQFSDSLTVVGLEVPMRDLQSDVVAQLDGIKELGISTAFRDRALAGTTPAVVAGVAADDTKILLDKTLRAINSTSVFWAMANLELRQMCQRRVDMFAAHQRSGVLWVVGFALLVT